MTQEERDLLKRSLLMYLAYSDDLEFRCIEGCSTNYGIWEEGEA